MFKFTCIVSQASLVAALSTTVVKQPPVLSIDFNSTGSEIVDCYLRLENSGKSGDYYDRETCIGVRYDRSHILDRDKPKFIVNRTPEELKKAWSELSYQLFYDFDKKRGADLRRFQEEVEAAFEEIHKEVSAAFSKGFFGLFRAFTSEELGLQQELASRFGHGKKITYHYIRSRFNPYRCLYGPLVSKTVTLPNTNN